MSAQRCVLSEHRHTNVIDKYLPYSKAWLLEVSGLRPREAKTCCREDDGMRH